MKMDFGGLVFQLSAVLVQAGRGEQYYDCNGTKCKFDIVPSDGTRARLLRPEQSRKGVLWLMSGIVLVEDLSRLTTPLSAALYWFERHRRDLQALEELAQKAEQEAVYARWIADDFESFVDVTELRLRRLQAVQAGALSVPPVQGGELSCVEE